MRPNTFIFRTFLSFSLFCGSISAHACQQELEKLTASTLEIYKKYKNVSSERKIETDSKVIIIRETPGKKIGTLLYELTQPLLMHASNLDKQTQILQFSFGNLPSDVRDDAIRSAYQQVYNNKEITRIGEGFNRLYYSIIEGSINYWEK